MKLEVGGQMLRGLGTMHDRDGQLCYIFVAEDLPGERRVEIERQFALGELETEGHVYCPEGNVLEELRIEKKKI